MSVEICKGYVLVHGQSENAFCKRCGEKMHLDSTVGYRCINVDCRAYKYRKE